MTDRRLVLHVGPHKTASSYVQENLFKSARSLQTHGWTYPREGTDGQRAHHHLAHNAADYLPRNAGGVDAKTPKLAATLAPKLASLAARTEKTGQNLVFSAEGMCRWKPTQFEALGDLLGFETIELVFVVRDPLDLFPSFWSEEVKQGHTLGFADRFAREFAAPFSSYMLNPMQLLGPLLRRKRLRLHVVPYDVLRREDLDIFEHICQRILGIPGIRARHVKPVNRGYPIELTEFLRLLTLMHSDDAAHIGSEFRLGFIRDTSAGERRQMVQLMKTSAAHARRVIKVPEGISLRSGVENLLRKNLDHEWSLDIGEAGIFRPAEQRFVYYNEYLLWKTDAIRSAAEQLLRRLAG